MKDLLRASKNNPTKPNRIVTCLHQNISLCLHPGCSGKDTAFWKNLAQAATPVSTNAKTNSPTSSMLWRKWKSMKNKPRKWNRIFRISQLWTTHKSASTRNYVLTNNSKSASLWWNTVLTWVLHPIEWKMKESSWRSSNQYCKEFNIFIKMGFLIEISNLRIFFTIRKMEKSRLLILKFRRRQFQKESKEICWPLLEAITTLLLRYCSEEAMTKELIFGV